MIRAAAILLLIAAAPASAADCYDLGHVGRCPSVKARTTCHGWRDATGSCHWEPGSGPPLAGMGPRGYVGRLR
jgi:hypothetical protein